MMARRDFLKAMGAAAVLAAPWVTNRGAMAAPARTPAAGGRQPAWSGLLRSLREEHDYVARVEGRLPAGLRGTLFRNGPGLFERAGLRKRALVDGDGMMQSFSFADGGARYRNRFVRTDKFVEEEQAGKYQYATWTTRRPGGPLSNVFGRALPAKGQAGVSVVERNGRVFAFDESTQVWEVDPVTLETRGFDQLGLANGESVYSAHSKLDSRNGDWLHFGLQYGRELTLHCTVFKADGSLRTHWTLPSPRYVYMHDFFVTERYLVLHLHPMEVGLGSFLSGFSSLTESFAWNPAKGSQWLVLDRDGKAPPVQLETEAVFQWHSLNAFEQGGEIAAEFVGYATPDQLVGKDPAMYAAMEGREGEHAFRGELRRVVLDPQAKTARMETLDGSGFEFPTVNPRVACHPHRFGYLATEAGDGFAWSGIARVDRESGKLERHRFPAGQYNGEAMFVPDPDRPADPQAGQEPGWLLSEVYDDHTQRSFLAVLDAEHVADGPLAAVQLEHHVPLSFHGWWTPRA